MRLAVGEARRGGAHGQHRQRVVAALAASAQLNDEASLEMHSLTEEA
ncbi:MAG TPA: hypothetical protein VJV05_14045 [Pyrinomonadaceae bacterium]|nr:hypothetical protein [Pyrinomonadaceae bacterium]HKP70404.1 hypothetical protein [Pyrinomonadaceae bacterium]